MNFYIRIIAGLVLSAILSTTAQACGAKTKCRIGDRHYYVVMPNGHDGETKVPAFIYAHGYKGTGKGVIRNSSLKKVASKLGIALIAVKSKRLSWSLVNSPRGSEQGEAMELAYFDAVKKDVTKRFAINPDKMIMSGFSTGGMVTWTLACKRSEMFAGFIPMSGTFWSSAPDTCKGKIANIVHFHGTKDKTVPLNGRPVAGTHQGSVPKALEMYRSYGNFSAAESAKIGNLKCELSANDKGNLLNLCLYEGGHSFRTNNIAVAWRMFQKAGQL